MGVVAFGTTELLLEVGSNSSVVVLHLLSCEVLGLLSCGCGQWYPNWF